MLALASLFRLLGLDFSLNTDHFTILMKLTLFSIALGSRWTKRRFLGAKNE
jgi:hypothetical protein